MAVTRLTDLKVPGPLFGSMIVQHSLKTDRFIDSGIATIDPTLTNFLSDDAGGWDITPRYLGALPNVQENISNDDPTDNSTPNALSAIQCRAIKHLLNTSFSSMDLAPALAGIDPLNAVKDQIAKYWTGRRQTRLISSVQGIIDDSVTNHDGDMVIDITKNAGEAGLINSAAILDARALFGDLADDSFTLAVHSVVYTTLEKLNLITVLPLSEQGRVFKTYMGHPIIVDDSLPVIAGEYDPSGADNAGDYEPTTFYHSYMFGPSAFGLGYGTPKMPWAVVRKEEAGHGGGQETVFSRTAWVIHPHGYSWVPSTGTPTYAQLETAASWNREWDRKRVKISAIITRG
jgi:hypothetical protein